MANKLITVMTVKLKKHLINEGLIKIKSLNLELNSLGSAPGQCKVKLIFNIFTYMQNSAMPWCQLEY